MKYTTIACSVCGDVIQYNALSETRGGSFYAGGFGMTWEHLCLFCRKGLAEAVESCMEGLRDKTLESQLQSSIHVVRAARSSN